VKEMELVLSLMDFENGNVAFLGSGKGVFGRRN